MLSIKSVTKHMYLNQNIRGKEINEARIRKREEREREREREVVSQISIN